MHRSVGLFLPVLVLMLGGCSQSAPETVTSLPPLVLVAEVAQEAANAQVFVGVVNARDVVNYSFGQTGVLATRDTVLGEFVNADQILASLDVSTLQLDLARAEADVASAQAQQDSATSGLARAQELADRSQVTDAQLQGIQQQVATADAGLAQALAAAEGARQQLELASLRASGSGIVTLIGAEPGQVVQAGQPVVAVARPDTKDLAIDVPAPLAGTLAIGSEFEVALQLDAAITSRGTLREISPQVDATAGTRRVLIELTDPPFPFWLGTTATATLVDAAEKTFLTVPTTAIFEVDGAASVWVVKGETPTVQRQQVAWHEGDTEGQAIVTEGLVAGDEVVRIGVDELENGQAVRVESAL